MSIVIGLTGMTGAGKSTVAEILKKHGAVVVDADRAARDIITLPEIINRLCEAFTIDILTEIGQINRSELAKHAFINKESAQILSNITHPRIIEECQRQIEEYKKQNIPLILLDAPLLYQSGTETMCDKVIFVKTNRQIQLARIIRRDGLTQAQAEARIAVQGNMARYEKKANYVIENNGSVEDMENQCINIIKMIHIS